MSVDAAPVTVIARPPFVVSADKAMPQDGVLSRTVVAEFTRTVVPAVSLLCGLSPQPSMQHKLYHQPLAGELRLCRGRHKAELLGRMTWFVVLADPPSAVRAVAVALVVAEVKTSFPD